MTFDLPQCCTMRRLLLLPVRPTKPWGARTACRRPRTWSRAPVQTPGPSGTRRPDGVRTRMTVTANRSTPPRSSRPSSSWPWRSSGPTSPSRWSAAPCTDRCRTAVACRDRSRTVLRSIWIVTLRAVRQASMTRILDRDHDHDDGVRARNDDWRVQWK